MSHNTDVEVTKHGKTKRLFGEFMKTVYSLYTAFRGACCFGLITPLPPCLRLFNSSKNWYLPILLGCLWNIDSSGLAPEKSDLRGLEWGRKCIIWQEPAKSLWSGNLENTTPGGEVTLPLNMSPGKCFPNQPPTRAKGFRKSWPSVALVSLPSPFTNYSLTWFSLPNWTPVPWCYSAGACASAAWCLPYLSLLDLSLAKWSEFSQSSRRF